MKAHRIVLVVTTLSCVAMVHLLQVGCKESPQGDTGTEEAKEEGVPKVEEQEEALATAEKHQQECIANLTRIDNAKEEWAINEAKMGGDEIVKSEVDSFIPGGAPKCPAGGTYSYGKIGEDPSCSVLGHALP
jgi:hypothetical protein